MVVLMLLTWKAKPKPQSSLCEQTEGRSVEGIPTLPGRLGSPPGGRLYTSPLNPWDQFWIYCWA